MKHSFDHDNDLFLQFLQNMTARHLSIFSYSVSQIIVTLSALTLGPGSTWLLKKMVVGSEGPFTNTHRVSAFKTP